MRAFAVRTLLIFVALPVGVALISGAPLWPLALGLLSYVLAVGWGARGTGAKGKARRFEPAPVIFMLVLFFALPTGLASVTGASWTTIGFAYLLWFGLLGLWSVQGLLSRRTTSGEAVGWPLIMGMFLTMGVVPVLSLILRLFGWP